MRSDQRLVFSSMVTGFSLEKFPKGDVVLSEREEQYLYYMSQGMKDCFINDKLYVSTRTLKRIKEQLLFKTGINSSSQLAVFSVLRDKEKR
ncbi:MAG: hypothetical protein KBS81_11930 [Spirochaetales bacterium]|nr:hypothetical protein [Candidatus Physcosoma equi]